MLCYVGQMGVWNEGERYEKGKFYIVEKRNKNTWIPIIKTSLKKDARFIQIVGMHTTR